MYVLTTIVGPLTWWVDPQSLEDSLSSQEAHARIYRNAKFYLTEVPVGWTWKDTIELKGS